MREFVVDARRLAEAKDHFREVIHSTDQSQIGVMVIAALEEYAEEPAPSDLVLVVIKGKAVLTMDDNQYDLAKSSLALIPAGTGYAVHNTSKRALRMITISSPPMLRTRTAAKGLLPRPRVGDPRDT